MAEQTLKFVLYIDKVKANLNLFEAFGWEKYSLYDIFKNPMETLINLLDSYYYKDNVADKVILDQ